MSYRQIAQRLGAGFGTIHAALNRGKAEIGGAEGKEVIENSAMGALRSEGQPNMTVAEPRDPIVAEIGTDRAVSDSGNLLEGTSEGNGPAPTSARRVPANNLAAEMKRIAVRLRRTYPNEIERDPRAFKKTAVSFPRRNLPPFPGHPTDEAITRAIHLRKEVQDWKVIYPLCILNHASLDPATRRQAENNLRGACRSRRNAAKRRARAAEKP